MHPAESAGTDGRRGVVIQDTGGLALFLGGSETSFTGQLLTLIAKADWSNRERLRLAFGGTVSAWEVWREMEPAPTWTELAAELANRGIQRDKP